MHVFCEDLPPGSVVTIALSTAPLHIAHHHPMLFLSAAAGYLADATLSGTTRQPAFFSPRGAFQQILDSAHISSLFIPSSVLEVSKAREPKGIPYRRLG